MDSSSERWTSNFSSRVCKGSLEKKRNPRDGSFWLDPISDEEDEEPLDPAAIKMAQGLVGELTWLPKRSRPDLLGVASKLIHRRPHAVLKIA